MKISDLNAKLIDFPSGRQANNSTCGAVSVQLVLAYYGINRNEEELSKLLKTTKRHGTTPENMVKVFRKFGLDTEEREGMSISDLHGYIRKEIPVVISFQAWDEGDQESYNDNQSGHYAIAIGFTNDSMLLEDPSLLGYRGYLDNKEFMNRWHDKSGNGKEYIRYGIPVIGKRIYNSNRLHHID